MGKGGGKGGLDMDALRSLMGSTEGKGSGKGKAKSKPKADGGGFFSSCCRRRVSTASASQPLLRSSDRLDVGDIVTVDGLKGAVELNGCQGKVLGFIEATGRYQVQLDDVEGAKALKLENLRAS